MDKSVRLSVRSFSDMEFPAYRIPGLETGAIVEQDGFIYLHAGKKVYSCENSADGRELLEKIRIAERLQKNWLSEEEALQDVLEGEADPSVLHRFGLSDGVQRCIILFRPLQNQDMRPLRDLIPADESDRLTMTENGDLALVMCTDHRTMDEVYEFAEAAAGTMESEAGIACCAGIGTRADDAAGLPDSYRKAVEAIITGLRHRISGRVFVYDRQTLERIADAIPPEKANAIRREILRPGSEKVLTEEILETIQVFFQNDLNLSTTARQLFIHRNTLLYRMEKVRKETGLDLRKFEDAVAFRMLMNPAGERKEYR